MNYQFFGTAGIISGVIGLLCLICYLIWETAQYSWKISCDTATICGWIAFISFSLIASFWLIIGIICGLDALWNWGLVKCQEQ